MASSVLADLVDRFLNQLDDREKQKVIDKVEREDPEAADILKRAWKMQKSGKKIKRATDRIEDLVS